MLVTAKQMRLAEQYAFEHGSSSAELMDNAGEALAAEIRGMYTGGRIFFLCGCGNNGGDGFVACRILREAGCIADCALMLGAPQTAVAAEALASLKGLRRAAVVDDTATINELCETAAIIVDCVFGTGFHGELPEKVISTFSQISPSALRIACDVPSGINSTTGVVAEGSFRADYSMTFEHMKAGMIMKPGCEQCGRIIELPIGIPPHAFGTGLSIDELSDDTIKDILKPRPTCSHKGDFGKLLCVTGSRRMSGACALSTLAALRCGAGLVTVATPKSVAMSLSSTIYEPLYLPLSADSDGFADTSDLKELIDCASGSDALLIGCGLGTTSLTRHLVLSLIDNFNGPIIIDADGINCIADCIDILQDRDNIVLTPHPGEMARLSGMTAAQIQTDRIAAASAFSQHFAPTLVLKGASTIVASGSSLWINTTGNPGMSRGGSGDVLAGMLASFVAQGIPVTEAALLAVRLHGLAGDAASQRLSRQAMLPSDMIQELPAIFADMQR